jgi:hypothetical protein
MESFDLGPGDSYCALSMHLQRIDLELSVVIDIFSLPKMITDG